MKVIQIKSKKGGVGKSEVARKFAELSAAAGCQTMLLDGSEQANDDILEDQQRSFDATLKECFLDDIPLRDAARQVRKNLWLLAGTRDHGDVNDFIRQEQYSNIFRDMVQMLRSSLTPLEPFEQRFAWWNNERISLNLFRTEKTTDEEFATPPTSLDFLVIDSDASTEDNLTYAVWEAVDGIIVPFDLTELDWQSYHQLKQDLAKRYRKRPQEAPGILGVLPNRVLHTKDNPTPLVYLRTIFGYAEERVFQPIHWSKIFGECLNQRLGCLEHPSAYTDRTVRELAAFVLDVMGYQGELAGLKFCDKCTEALNQAMEEKEVQEQVS